MPQIQSNKVQPYKVWQLDTWWKKTVYVIGWVSLAGNLLILAYILTILSYYF